MGTRRHTGSDHPHDGDAAVPGSATNHCTEVLVIDIGKDTYTHRDWLYQYSFDALGRSA